MFGGVRCNLKEAIQHAGLAWEGRAHCGLDDAMNTARLLAHLMHHGFKFTITNSLDSASPEFLPTAPPLQQSRKMVYQHPLIPSLHFQPLQKDSSKEQEMYCYCGVKSSKRMVRKPGPKHGSFFFGCGNWTTARGAACHYFQWASPWRRALKDSLHLRAKATRKKEVGRKDLCGKKTHVWTWLGHIEMVGGVVVSFKSKCWEVLEGFCL